MVISVAFNVIVTYIIIFRNSIIYVIVNIILKSILTLPVEGIQKCCPPSWATGGRERPWASSELHLHLLEAPGGRCSQQYENLDDRKRSDHDFIDEIESMIIIMTISSIVKKNKIITKNRTVTIESKPTITTP